MLHRERITCDYTLLAACVHELRHRWLPAKIDQVRALPDRAFTTPASDLAPGNMLRNECTCCVVASVTSCPRKDTTHALRGGHITTRKHRRQKEAVALFRSSRQMTVLSVSSSDLHLKSQRKQAAQAAMRRGRRSLLLLCIPGSQLNQELRRVRATHLIFIMSTSKQIQSPFKMCPIVLTRPRALENGTSSFHTFEKTAEQEMRLKVAELEMHKTGLSRDFECHRGACHKHRGLSARWRVQGS